MAESEKKEAGEPVTVLVVNAKTGICCCAVLAVLPSLMLITRCTRGGQKEAPCRFTQRYQQSPRRRYGKGRRTRIKGREREAHIGAHGSFSSTDGRR
jgi:hypothetical protein